MSFALFVRTLSGRWVILEPSTGHVKLPCMKVKDIPNFYSAVEMAGDALLLVFTIVKRVNGLYQLQALSPLGREIIAQSVEENWASLTEAV